MEIKQIYASNIESLKVHAPWYRWSSRGRCIRVGERERLGSVGFKYPKILVANCVKQNTLGDVEERTAPKFTTSRFISVSIHREARVNSTG